MKIDKLGIKLSTRDKFDSAPMHMRVLSTMSFAVPDDMSCMHVAICTMSAWFVALYSSSVLRVSCVISVTLVKINVLGFAEHNL